MKGGVELKRLRDLVRLFDGLRMLHEELFRALESKIDAMRRADVGAMQAVAEGERDLTRRLQEREGFRRQLMENIGGELGLSAKAARSLTVTKLAQQLPDPERTLVLNAASRLREAMAKSAQANRIAAAIAREVVHHMKCVFSAVRPQGMAPVGYTGRGQTVSRTDASLFEAIG